jgi:hypothetical protein
VNHREQRTAERRNDMPADEYELAIDTEKCRKCGKETIHIRQYGAEADCECDEEEFDDYSLSLSSEALERLADMLAVPRCVVCNRVLAFSGQRKDIRLTFDSAERGVHATSYEQVPCCQSCSSTASEQDLILSCKRHLDEQGPSVVGLGFPGQYSEKQVKDVLVKAHRK